MRRIFSYKMVTTGSIVCFTLILSCFLAPVNNTKAKSLTPLEAPDSVCFEIWDAVINVADNGGANQDLVFGQGFYASDSFDACDTQSPPAPPAGSFHARIVTPSTPPADLFKDYRKADKPGIIEWKIKFQPGSGGYPFTFSWDITKLPAAGTLQLMDVFGGSMVNVDMLAQSSYQLTNTDLDQLKIRYNTNRCTITAIASGNWSSGSTWNTNCTGLPSVTDDVHIPDGISVTFDNAPTTIESLTVSGGTGLLQFSNSNPLVVSDNAFIRGGMFDLGDTGTVTVSGALSNEGKMKQTKSVTTGLGNVPTASVNFLDLGGYGGLTITANSETLGTTTVTIKGGQSCDTNDSSVHRCFTITPTNNTSTASLNYFYSGSELNGSSCSNLQAWRTTGGTTWVEAGTIGTRTCVSDPYSLSYSNITLNNTGSFFALRTAQNPTVVNLMNLEAYSGIDTKPIYALGSLTLALVGLLSWQVYKRMKMVKSQVP